MSAIATAIGGAVDAFLANPAVGLAAHLVEAYVILVWLAVALWAFVDMRRRTTHLPAAYGAAALVILASPVLFPLAVVILRIVRPAAFAAEQRLAQVRESVLAADLIPPRCPDCHRTVEPEWILCPSCRQLLAHMCIHCGRTVDLDWSICAWCGEELQSAGPTQLTANA